MQAMNRRNFMGSGIATGGLLAAGAAAPAWARGASLHHGGMIRTGFDEVSGRDIRLTVGEGMRVVQGRRGHAVAVTAPFRARWFD